MNIDACVIALKELSNSITLKLALEILTGQVLPAQSQSKFKAPLLENATAILQFLKANDVIIANLDANDIVQGDEEKLKQILWAIFKRFQVCVVYSMNKT